VDTHQRPRPALGRKGTSGGYDQSCHGGEDLPKGTNRGRRLQDTPIIEEDDEDGGGLSKILTHFGLADFKTEKRMKHKIETERKESKEKKRVAE